MRSLITALIILLMISGGAAANSLAVTRGIDEMTECADGLGAEPDAEKGAKLRDRWETLEPLLKATADDERLRDVSAALGELDASALGSEADRLRAKEALLLALGEIGDLEKPTLSQIF